MPIQYPEQNITFNASKLTYGLRNQHYQLLTLVNGQDYDPSVATPVLYLPKPIQGCPMIIRNVDGSVQQNWWIDIKRYDRKDINGSYGYMRFFTPYGYLELWPFGDDWIQKGIVCQQNSSGQSIGYQFVLGKTVAQSIPADTWTDVAWNTAKSGPTQVDATSVLNPEWNSATGVMTPTSNLGIPGTSMFRIYGTFTWADPATADVVLETRAVSPSGSIEYGGWSTVSDGSNPPENDRRDVFPADVSHKWQVKHNHSGALNLTSASMFYWSLNGW